MEGRLRAAATQALRAAERGPGPSAEARRRGVRGAVHAAARSPARLRRVETNACFHELRVGLRQGAS